jgi:hypothetical protein
MFAELFTSNRDLAQVVLLVGVIVGVLGTIMFAAGKAWASALHCACASCVALGLLLL